MRVVWLGLLVMLALFAGASLRSGGAQAQGGADCYARCDDSLNAGMCRGFCDTAGPTPSGPPRPRVYGAISTTKTEYKLEWGTSAGHSSQRAAEDAANADCDKRAGKRGACKMDIWFYNNCAALAVAKDTATDASYAATLRGAERQAISYCQKAGGKECKVVKSFCTG